MNYIVKPNLVGNSLNRFLTRNIGILDGSVILASNESRLANNETRGGNLPLSGR